MSAPVSNAPGVKVVTLSDSSTEWGNAVDRTKAKAKDAGIEWQRPKDDHRTADDIIHDSPLLKNLSNQSGVKDKLRERVGDFEHDADAAYRANQVLEHVERFDENGSRLAGNAIENGRVDGFTKGGDAKHGTERPDACKTSASTAGRTLRTNCSPRFLPGLAATAGVLGFLGAGVAVLAAIIPGLVKEGQAQVKSDKFGEVLGDSIERYGIGGAKDGTIADIPTKDWPGGEEWTS